MDISVIIVSYNTAQLLEKCIDSLQNSKGSLSIQLIIIDNASQDDSVSLLKRKYGEHDIIFNEKNIGFGRANNQALPLLKGRYVLLLNTDAFVSPDTLSKTVDYMESRSKCGILGVKLTGADGLLQPSCRYFPNPLGIFLNETGLTRFFKSVGQVDDFEWDHESVRECDWVPGCYYLVRREVVDQVGLFDPRYFLYYEEVDHCRAVKNAGWDVIYYPGTSVVHLGGESAKSDSHITATGRQVVPLQIESELLYFRKNHGLSAVLFDVVLVSVADIIKLLKGLLKFRGLVGFKGYAEHLSALYRILIKTKFGSNPTR